ncbi:MAG TPA: hypothetical protein VNF91_02715 [Candidatus Acidoferrum sp.]|nr:hypothetical protein [Candidatus Acidoferrum sp.]
MRVRPVVGALAFSGLLIGLVVAVVIGTAPGGHQVIAVAWTIQVLVLIGALLLLANRMRRRS